MNKFNTINTIDMLNNYDPAQAEKMTVTLSDGREISGEFFED